MDEKIEAVARALCRFYGRDPDARTRSPGGAVGFHAQGGGSALDGPPLWDAYKDEAEKFVAMSEALQAFGKPVDP